MESAAAASGESRDSVGYSPPTELKSDSCRQIRSRLIEAARLTLGPLIKPGGVNDDFAVRSQLHEGAVHRPGRGPFEIDPFVVVAASVARTFELVFAGLPVRRTAEVGTTSVDDKDTIGSAIHPDAIFLLPFRVDTQTVIGGITDLEDGGWFEKSARQKKTEKRQKPCRQKGGDRNPHQPAAALIDDIVFRTNRGHARGGGGLRGAHRTRTNVGSSRSCWSRGCFGGIWAFCHDPRSSSY